MDLSAPDWAVISALFDEALELPPDARAAWLDRLPPSSTPFREKLRALLASHAAAQTSDFLAVLPRLPVASTEVAHADPHDADAADTVVGPYRVVRELGRGGMGSVWLAERTDGLIKRPVALKLPHPRIGSARFTERFAREREILSGLANPNITRLYDAGVTQRGQPYIALEYVEGVPLIAYCDEHKLDIRHRLGILLQVLKAVQHAHSQLVVHRDLKPSNVLVSSDGQVHLLDFGIAKLVKDGETRETELTQFEGAALTPDYASPEQIAGKPIGTASDVYSLGVLMYELMTGARPYRLKRDSRGALEDAILAAAPGRPSTVVTVEGAGARGTSRSRLARMLRGDLDTIILKALKKEPAERYGTVEAFAQDLQNFLDGKPVMARPDSATYRIYKFVARNRMAVSASAVAVVSLICVSVVSVWQASIAQREARRAVAVQGFLTDIFRSNADTHPDPLKARQTTARELLDIGAKRIDDNFKNDPVGQAEVLDLLGEMYFDVGLDPEAAEFYRRRVIALKSVYGEQDPRVAEALVAYGSQLEGLGRTAEQLGALDEARRILDHNGDFTSEQRALLLKSMSRAYSHSEAKGLALAEEAVRIYRDYHPEGKGYPGALTRLGYARMWVGDDEGAEAALADALARLERDTNPSVSGTITALLALGEVQAKRGRIAEAESNYRRALQKSVAINGPAHEDTLHAEVRLGWFLHQTSRRDEGRKWLESAFGKMTGGGYTPNVIDAVRSHVALSLLDEGRLDRAEPLVAEVVRDDRKAAPGASLLLASSLRSQAQLWILQGRLDDAARALDEAFENVSKIVGPVGDPSMTNALLLTRARQQLASRDSASALTTLEGIRPQPDARQVALRIYEVQASALTSAAQLELDQVEAAMATAKAGNDALIASGLRDYYQPLEAEVLLALGKAKLRQGDVTAAGADLERAMRLRLANEDPASPLLAESELAFAESLLAAGDRGRSAQLVASARSRYAKNAKVGPQFIEALARLDARSVHASDAQLSASSRRAHNQ
jgi:serine/threonine-protein kinase